MSIDFTCVGCGKAYSLAPTLAGKKAKCKACGHEFRVPRPDAAPDVDDLDPYGLAEEPGLAPAPIPGPARFEPEDPAPPRRAATWPKPKRQAAGEGAAEQARGLGFVLLILGVASFILPMVGLQVKGLHKLDPASQATGGFLLMCLGGGVVLLSYLKASLGGFFKVVGIGVGGLFGLVILSALVLPALRGRNAPPPPPPGMPPPGFAPEAFRPPFPESGPAETFVTIPVAQCWRTPPPFLEWEFRVDYEVGTDPSPGLGSYFWVIESSVSGGKQLIPGPLKGGRLTGSIVHGVGLHGPFTTYIAREEMHPRGGFELKPVSAKVTMQELSAMPAELRDESSSPPPPPPPLGNPFPAPPTIARPGPPGLGPPGPPLPPGPAATASAPAPPPAPMPLDQALADLKAAEPHRRHHAANVLAATTPDPARQAEVVAALRPLLDEPQAFARQAAAKALRAWGTPELLDTWLGLLDDGSLSVRWDALAALGEIPDPRAAEAVAARLKSDRLKARDALARMGKVAAPAVVSLLDDEEWTVRLEAARLLREIGDAESVPALRRRLADENALVRKAVEDALRALGAGPAPRRRGR